MAWVAAPAVVNIVPYTKFIQGGNVELQQKDSALGQRPRIYPEPVQPP